jgi:hypothetical protein
LKKLSSIRIATAELTMLLVRSPFDYLALCSLSVRL